MIIQASVGRSERRLERRIDSVEQGIGGGTDALERRIADRTDVLEQRMEGY